MTRRYYHGTAHPDEIREDGFRISTAGGGQMGLRGVWLTEDLATARRYAESAGRYCWLHDRPRCPGARPAVLTVEVPGRVRIADVRGLGRLDAIRRFAGIDPREQTADVAWMRATAPWSLTIALQSRGYGGARIDSTLRHGSADEIVVFNPADAVPIGGSEG